MASGRRSLAEDIADLLEPVAVQEAEPDAHVVLDGGPTLEESDEDLAGVVGMGRARILPDIALDDPAYAGVRSSRATAFESDDFTHDAAEEPAESPRGSDASTSQSEDERPGHHTEPQDDDEVAALERAVEDLQAGDGDTAAYLAERANREKRKALAVQSQRRLWEAGLEIRILLQRLLKSAVRFPQGVLAKTIQASDQGVAAAVEDIRAESAGAISDLLEVIKGLHERNPAIAATPPKWQRKERRDSTALWRCADAWYEATKPFQDASIDRWQRKTLVAGGNLKALNQPVSHQVAQLMQASDAVIERTQLERDQTGVIGQPIQPQQAAGSKPGDRDPETFDDTDFYSTLLKEFLESTEAPALTSQKYAGTKKRKIVDRRASKGRKIRYNVQEKLVNFMASRESGSLVLASQLFGNLFGSGA
uniref:Protein AATF n=1 Tax=Auxenochlorella protothecoides TaxID=3075 RepID=A0A1D2A909_AUXPR